MNTGRPGFASLAYRFSFYIFLIFLSIGILLSAINASVSLDRQVKRFEAYLNEIVNKSAAHITRDLWITDYSQVLYQLKIIQTFPFVRRVEIHSDTGQSFTAGDPGRRHYKPVLFPLVYEYEKEKKDLGQLAVFVDYELMRGEIFSDEIRDFVLHLALVIILAVSVVLLFNSMIGRHLVAMTAFIQKDEEIRRWKPFFLQRRHSFQDELALLAEAFNSFQKRNHESLEHEMIMSKEMEKLAKDKETFLSIISHDLRSPVSGFKNLASLLVQDFENIDRNELRISLIELEKAGARVYDMLENLLEWSALERGNLTFRKDKLSGCQLLKNGIESLQENARSKNIRLDLSCTEDYFVFCDERMMMVVMRNLISNAVKFTPPGGSVTSGISRDSSMVRFEIRDTGVGMDLHQAAALFNRQQKNSSPGTQGEKGTGIGSVLTAEFIELQGGKIWAESTPGSGTSIFFVLPGINH